ncbi:MAG: hypothetical protein FE78DRAFT_66586 [Acidomyces sp. 'richmondensis']|nr:MAG: hypothetical protein FE78DRAFT_66586 [Acidomyces sp. 'richmondensis']
MIQSGSVPPQKEEFTVITVPKIVYNRCDLKVPFLIETIFSEFNSGPLLVELGIFTSEDWRLQLPVKATRHCKGSSVHDKTPFIWRALGPRVNMANKNLQDAGKPTECTSSMLRSNRLKKKIGRMSSGRPPLAKKPQAALSAAATRNVIRTHHQLTKELVKAEAQGKETEANELKKRISDLGGLKSYQAASIIGQSGERGGDSSVVLMTWLEPLAAEIAKSPNKLKLLEVGALSTKNACAKSGLFDIERIDLFSETKEIIQQDFMKRPIPSCRRDQFDIISLSLVLNFVPDPVGRGEMLKHTCRFLNNRAAQSCTEQLKDAFPALFLVLPAPCIWNSRFMSEQRLICLMASLGYVLLQHKLTAKLMYTLWLLRDDPVPEEQDFPKKLINPGGGRNNFSIVLKK